VPYKITLTLGVNDLVPFGTYKGEVIRSLIYNKTDFVVWAIDAGVFRLDEGAMNMLQKVIDVSNRRK
jgi:hypothetical protein